MSAVVVGLYRKRIRRQCKSHVAGSSSFLKTFLVSLLRDEVLSGGGGFQFIREGMDLIPMYHV